MKKISAFIIVAVYLMLPVLTFAQLPPVDTPEADERIGGLIGQFGNILETLLPIFVTLAVLAFFWGLIKFIFTAGDSRDEGKQIMLWGIISLFVIVSIWGIVGFLANLFGIGTGGSAPVPGVQGLGQ
jgi:hypothetical protein